MTSKEEEIKKICYDVVHTYSVIQEDGNSYCPFCHNGNEDGKHYEIEDIEHDTDCAYIIALKFYEEEKIF